MNHAGLPSLILPAVYATYRKSPDIEVEFACTRTRARGLAPQAARTRDHATLTPNIMGFTVQNNRDRSMID